jgi:hypothetical protein
MRNNSVYPVFFRSVCSVTRRDLYSPSFVGGNYIERSEQSHVFAIYRTYNHEVPGQQAIKCTCDLTSFHFYITSLFLVALHFHVSVKTAEYKIFLPTFKKLVKYAY